MTQDFIPFSKIVVEIERLSKQKATGTLFIVTQDNRSAQMMLDNGEIVYLLFSSKRGQDALELMKTMNFGRFRFQEGGALSRRMPLPPTEMILKTLSNGSGIVQERPPVVRSTEGTGLSTEQKSILESCLADCIGPMASIICEDHCSSASNLQAAVDALAEEIAASGQAKRFREMVSERLS